MDTDTAENEQHFAEILPKGRRVAAPRLSLGFGSAGGGRGARFNPSGTRGGRVGVTGSPHFGGLVLGGVDADFAIQASLENAVAAEIYKTIRKSP